MPPLLGSPSSRPHDNLERDAELFRALDAGHGGEGLCIWESRQTAVIVGWLGSVDRDVHQEACRADGVPILRRVSGGGTVVIGPGCLNYSLILSLEKRPELGDVAASYERILAPLAAALAVPGLAPAGCSDLALDGRKVAGSAQRRGRSALLHHGTILCDFDIPRLERYLRQPVRQPAYRADRSHTDFVTNLGMGPDDVRAAIVRAWGRESRRPTPVPGMGRSG